jgi:hypothetical protein
MAANNGNSPAPAGPPPLTPRPVSINIAGARMSDGKDYVIVTLHDGNASLAGFIEPDRALALADALTQLAHRAETGLIIAKPGDVPPNPGG